MIWIWAGVVVTLSFIEKLTKKAIAGCFVISGIFAAIAAFFTDRGISGNNPATNNVDNVDGYIIQLALFFVVGVLLLLIVRPFILQWLRKCKKKKKGKKT